MKIAVIGAGHVGGTLGKGWAKKGHAIVYGVPDPSKYVDIDSLPVSQAAKDAEVVVFATPWSATKDAIKEAGDLSGKIVVDATNPIASNFNGLIAGSSAGEQVGEWAQDAHVVKAFNTVGFNVMANPQFPQGAATMLVAGDDTQAKEKVMQLARDLGFDAVDAGPLSQSKYLEAFAWLWISMAMKYGHGREMAFQLMKR